MENISWLGMAKEFAMICEENDLHGLSFQHIVLCTRRAWLHLNRVNYAHLDARMQRGLVLHDISKPRDTSVEGLLGLAPDRIDWNKNIIIESKGGSGAVKAVSAQTTFYALMLSAATNKQWQATNNLLEEKRYRKVHIDYELVKNMLKYAKTLSKLKNTKKTPDASQAPICKSCSYRFLCGFY